MDRKDFNEEMERLKKEAHDLYTPYRRSENQIEERLCEGVKKLKGQCWKFVSPGRAGVPDRILMIPNGMLFFVELKALGCYPRPIQKMVHEMLEFQKQKVIVLSDYFEVDRFLRQLEGWLNYKKIIKDRYSTEEDNEI